MYPYVERVLSQLGPAEFPGLGGYLRINPDADQEYARSYLTEERNIAQAEVERLNGPPQLLNARVPMQMLILVELLLKKPNEPIDIRTVTMAQGGQAYVAERIEEAASGLMMMAPRLFEFVMEL
jgi:hypothetical protein